MHIVNLYYKHLFSRFWNAERRYYLPDLQQHVRKCHSNLHGDYTVVYQSLLQFTEDTE